MKRVGLHNVQKNHAYFQLVGIVFATVATRASRGKGFLPRCHLSLYGGVNMNLITKGFVPVVAAITMWAGAAVEVEAGHGSFGRWGGSAYESGASCGSHGHRRHRRHRHRHKAARGSYGNFGSYGSPSYGWYRPTGYGSAGSYAYAQPHSACNTCGGACATGACASGACAACAEGSYTSGYRDSGARPDWNAATQSNYGQQGYDQQGYNQQGSSPIPAAPQLDQSAPGAGNAQQFDSPPPPPQGPSADDSANRDDQTL